MRNLLYGAALIGMSAAPLAVKAQTEAGSFLAYANDYEAFGVGAFGSLSVPAVNPNIALVPGFTWYFPDGGKLLEINGDVMHRFPVSADSPVLSFFFAGLNIARRTVAEPGIDYAATEVGVNLGGGVNFVAGSVNPFAGAKVELEGGESFVIFGGLAFPIGGGA